MKIEEYQALAMRTSPPDHDRILNGCLGLIGESGEVIDAIKKWKFQSGKNPELPREKLIDELGDVLWYCAELCEGIGEDISSIFKYCVRNRFKIIQNPIIESAVLLSYVCANLGRTVDMFTFLCTDEEDSSDDDNRKCKVKEIAWPKLAQILQYVMSLLDLYCNSTLEEAMEHNIEKLKRRYPDGFDPERSLHRPE